MKDNENTGNRRQRWSLLGSVVSLAFLVGLIGLFLLKPYCEHLYEIVLYGLLTIVGLGVVMILVRNLFSRRK